MVTRRVVYQCPDCMGMTEAIHLTALGGKVRPAFRESDGRPLPGVVVRRILCWWCREYHSPEEVEACMTLPRKIAGAENSQSSTSSVLDAGPLKQFSELWAFLTATAFPDGAKRRTGRISVSFESGLLGLLLTDEETGQYAFLNGRSLDDLLAEAELRLGDGSLTFKASKWQRRNGSK